MRQRSDFRLPPRGRGWLGENNWDGQTDDVFLAGCLSKLRNYHLLSRGRLLRRQGWTRYEETQVDGSTALQGLGVYSFNNSDTLIAQANGKVKRYDGTDWTDITGSLTLTAGQNILTRFTNFHDGSAHNIVAANDTNNPYYWPGSGNAVPLCITQAADLASFKHHLFAIRTSDRPTSIRYSGPGVISSFPTNNLFDCTRNSRGVALQVHTDETLLAFYETEVFKIQYNYGSTLTPSSSFVNSIVDGTKGCTSRTSVVSSDGYTYFYSNDGFYRIGRVDRPAEKISQSIQSFLDATNQSREVYISGFVRGKPWDEICWFVSGAGEAAHNYVLVFNPSVAQRYGTDFGWSIFESADGRMKFNCGVNFSDGNGIHRSLLGTYDGYVAQAFGTDNSGTTYADGPTGSHIRTEIETGLLDFGYGGMKGLREVLIDLETRSSNTFQITLRTTDVRATVPVTGDGLGLSLDDFFRYADAANGLVTIGTQGDVLNVSFVLNESYLVNSGVSQAVIEARADGRYFSLNIVETSATIPYIIDALTFLFKAKGMRIK